MDDFGGYHESTEQVRTEEVPLSHLSIETGHLFMVDLLNGEEKIRAQFENVSPIVDFHIEDTKRRFGDKARVSTCFLMDDFFRPDTEPAVILEKLLGVAEDCGLRIDYLARAAGCSTAPVYADNLPTTAIQLAEMVASRIVAEPVEEKSTGQRPPDVKSGWLCNGRRSSDHEPIHAMRRKTYRPPVERGRREHSIFLDVQLWDTFAGEDDRGNRWSCPLLAAVWRMLRLGLLRDHGRAVAQPVPWKPGDGWPETWSAMPAVTRLNPAAKPFSAYRALSILPRRYLGIEHAVHLILDHVALDGEIHRKMVDRAALEAVPVHIPAEITQRLSVILLDGQ
ncbi:SCO2522 family protein [Nocardia sp. NPDC004068]|uniref:SCO2522 family protein n=1 Tax=Nocardia sp. NPDC004068 TaxID=3364303 RepID=UPI0036B53666